MTAPSVVASPTESADPNDATSYTVDLPATVNAGDLLLIVMGGRSNSGNFTFAEDGSDYTEKINSTVEIAGGVYQNIAVFAKVADGSEDGGTVTFTTASTLIAFAAHCFRITGGDIDKIEGTAGGQGTGSFYDPPAHTPSGGSDDYLYLAASIVSDDDASFLDFPDGYGGGVYTQTGGGTNSSVSLATCYKQTTGSSSDNPNSFQMSELEGHYGCTLSIGPGGGGAPASILPTMMQHDHFGGGAFS